MKKVIRHFSIEELESRYKQGVIRGRQAEKDRIKSLSFIDRLFNRF